MPNLPKHRVLPENIDDHVVLKEHIFQVLEGDDYWHDRIKCILADAGFITRRIEREEAHPIWLAWLTRTTFDLSPDNKKAIKQIRKVLSKGGINVVRDEFNIIDRRGDKLRCVFMLDLGAPGVLDCPPPPRPGIAVVKARTAQGLSSTEPQVGDEGTPHCAYVEGL